MTFWDYGNFVSWEHCIEANRLCNLENCPDTMNCCVTNCVGSPTILGLAVAFGFMLVTLTIVYGTSYYFRKKGEETE